MNKKKKNPTQYRNIVKKKNGSTWKVKWKGATFGKNLHTYIVFVIFFWKLLGLKFVKHPTAEWAREKRMLMRTKRKNVCCVCMIRIYILDRSNGIYPIKTYVISLQRAICLLSEHLHDLALGVWLTIRLYFSPVHKKFNPKKAHTHTRSTQSTSYYSLGSNIEWTFINGISSIATGFGAYLLKNLSKHIF